MPKLPDAIVLSVVNGKYSLTIDGDEFPWFVADGDLAPQPGRVSGSEMPVLTITLLANRVQVEHDLDSPEIRAKRQAAEV